MEISALEKISIHKKLVSTIGEESILPGIKNYDISTRKLYSDEFDLIDIFTYFDAYDYLLRNENFVYQKEWQETLLRIIDNTKKFFLEMGLPLNQETMYQVLVERINNHDNTKLEEPELTKINLFYMDYLKSEVGSPNYHKLYNLVEKNHKEKNPHHPEFYENQALDMNLIDLLEMLIDLRSHSLEDEIRFFGILVKFRDKYQINETLFNLLRNTYNHYLKTLEKTK